jgi:hypothetical protein
MSEPQNPVATVKLAYRGQAINLDEIPHHELPPPGSVSINSQFKDYEPAIDVDYEDLLSVNRQLIELRMRIHRIRKELEVAKRRALAAKYVYESEKKRVWIGITGGSDKSREAAAELMCEESLTKYLVANTVADEINQHSRDIKTELDTLKEISNNLRRQIGLND